MNRLEEEIQGESGKAGAAMKIYEGKSVFYGIAIGKIRLLKKEKRNVVRTHIEDVEGIFFAKEG